MSDNFGISSNGKIIDQVLYSYLISNLYNIPSKEILKSLYGYAGFPGGILYKGQNVAYLLTSSYNVIKADAGSLTITGGSDNDVKFLTIKTSEYNDEFGITNTEGTSIEYDGSTEHSVMHPTQYYMKYYKTIPNSVIEETAVNVGSETSVAHTLEELNRLLILSGGGNHREMLPSIAPPTEICWYEENLKGLSILKINLTHYTEYDELNSLIKRLQELHSGWDTLYVEPKVEK